MNPFYVSDTYSLPLPGDVVWSPGPFNQDVSYGPGLVLRARLWTASLDLAVLNWSGAANIYSGIAVDLQLELYKVDSGVAIPTGVVLGFAPPYGSAVNGQVINHSAEVDRSPVARRNWVHSPLVLKGTTPADPGAYQLGARLHFHNGIGVCHGHVQYHIHGYTEIVP